MLSGRPGRSSGGGSVDLDSERCRSQDLSQPKSAGKVLGPLHDNPVASPQSQKVFEYRDLTGLMPLDSAVRLLVDMGGESQANDGSKNRRGATDPQGHIIAAENAGRWVAGGCWAGIRWLDLVA